MHTSSPHITVTSSFMQKAVIAKSAGIDAHRTLLLAAQTAVLLVR